MIDEDTDTCDHGLSAWLCAGPGHYPTDDQFSSFPATMGEAHAEWHRNAGVPMGTPGCPQDACHPTEVEGPCTYLSDWHVRMAAGFAGRTPDDAEVAALVGTLTGDLGCSPCEIGQDHDQAEHDDLVTRRKEAEAQLEAWRAEEAARAVQAAADNAKWGDEPPF